MTKKYSQVSCCGLLTIQNKEYFLLHPEPLNPVWESEEYSRFLVVPVGFDEQTEFSYPRHLVTKDFSIEYFDNKNICVEDRQWQYAEIVNNDVELEFIPEEPKLPEWFLELEKIDG